ncbi:ROK family protein [Aquimarina addita]|uniref:ROK family protein n=1 Tax=Aquimarina addita TaxID=870485 RepID=A0ABP6USX4_9FLAO
MKVVAGIDIGGTKTKIGLVDKDGNNLVQTDFYTREYFDLNAYLLHIVNTIKELHTQLPIPGYTLVGIGIGAPNASSRRGTIEHAPNLVWKGIVPFLDELKKLIDLPAKIMNDASAAALGEMLFGHAKEMKDFIVVTLGTGFGSGIVANGQLIEGFDGFAGELGHTDLTLGDGRLTGLGIKGGLEAYVSSTGLKRTILYMLCKYMDDSKFRSFSYDDLHGEDIMKAAEEGDPIALKAFEYTGRILGFALANFTAFTQPEAFFLMGGLANSGSWIFEPTKKYLEKHLLEIYKGKVKVLPSGMIGKNAAILGAAALIWEDFKK